MLNRTFGCVRLVWNKTFAERSHRYRTEGRTARTISDVAWGEFRAMLQYKAHRAGRTLLVVDRWYPSTKTCSSCGHLLAELSLSIRHWTCPNCRTRHDRDLNAAKQETCVVRHT